MNRPQSLNVGHCLWSAVALVAAAWSLPGHAALVGRDLDGNLATFEAYYDTVLDITWLADANYAQTSGFDADGRMTWAAATAWAAGLDPYGSGITGWRLPDTDPINGISHVNNAAAYDGSKDSGWNVSAPGSDYPLSTASELAHLYYNTLGNLSPWDPVASTAAVGVAQGGWGLVNTGPFSNIQAKFYWSSTAYVNNRAWAVRFLDGYQYANGNTGLLYAWAVHEGDVGAVPLPASAWLLLSGLAGLGFIRRRRVVA